MSAAVSLNASRANTPSVRSGATAAAEGCARVQEAGADAVLMNRAAGAGQIAEASGRRISDRDVAAHRPEERSLRISDPALVAAKIRELESALLMLPEEVSVAQLRANQIAKCQTGLALEASIGCLVTICRHLIADDSRAYSAAEVVKACIAEHVVAEFLELVSLREALILNPEQVTQADLAAGYRKIGLLGAFRDAVRVFGEPARQGSQAQHLLRHTAIIPAASAQKAVVVELDHVNCIGLDEYRQLYDKVDGGIAHPGALTEEQLGARLLFAKRILRGMQEIGLREPPAVPGEPLPSEFVAFNLNLLLQLIVDMGRDIVAINRGGKAVVARASEVLQSFPAYFHGWDRVLIDPARRCDIESRYRLGGSVGELRQSRAWAAWERFRFGIWDFCDDVERYLLQSKRFDSLPVTPINPPPTPVRADSIGCAGSDDGDVVMVSLRAQWQKARKKLQKSKIDDEYIPELEEIFSIIYRGVYDRVIEAKQEERIALQMAGKIAGGYIANYVDFSKASYPDQLARAAANRAAVVSREIYVEALKRPMCVSKAERLATDAASDYAQLYLMFNEAYSGTILPAVLPVLSAGFQRWYLDGYCGLCLPGEEVSPYKEAAGNGAFAAAYAYGVSCLGVLDRGHYDSEAREFANFVAGLQAELFGKFCLYGKYKRENFREVAKNVVDLFGYIYLGGREAKLSHEKAQAICSTAYTLTWLSFDQAAARAGDQTQTSFAAMANAISSYGMTYLEAIKRGLSELRADLVGSVALRIHRDISPAIYGERHFLPEGEIKKLVPMMTQLILDAYQSIIAGSQEFHLDEEECRVVLLEAAGVVAKWYGALLTRNAVRVDDYLDLLRRVVMSLPGRYFELRRRGVPHEGALSVFWGIASAHSMVYFRGVEVAEVVSRDMMMTAADNYAVRYFEAFMRMCLETILPTSDCDAILHGCAGLYVDLVRSAGERGVGYVAATQSLANGLTKLVNYHKTLRNIPQLMTGNGEHAHPLKGDIALIAMTALGTWVSKYVKCISGGSTAAEAERAADAVASITISAYAGARTRGLDHEAAWNVTVVTLQRLTINMIAHQQ